MANKEKYTLPNGDTIHIFPTAYYLATKLEAVASRGGSDLRFSHDFEDFIYVLNGRIAIKEELKAITDDELRNYLASKFQELLNDSNIEECINYALPIGEEERCEHIYWRCQNTCGITPYPFPPRFAGKGYPWGWFMPHGNKLNESDTSLRSFYSVTGRTVKP